MESGKFLEFGPFFRFISDGLTGSVFCESEVSCEGLDPNDQREDFN